MELARTRKSVPLPVGAMAGYFGDGNAMWIGLHPFETPSMPLRLLQFSFGILLCGISIAMLVRAGLGLGPWDVFHEGGAERTGLSFGSVLAVVISWTANKSLLWAIVHGLLSWLYVIYYALVYHFKLVHVGWA